MRHFTSTQDWTVGELQALLDQAAGLRSDPVRRPSARRVGVPEEPEPLGHPMVAIRVGAREVPVFKAG